MNQLTQDVQSVESAPDSSERVVVVDIDYENAVAFLANIAVIGDAWSEAIGGFGGLRITGRGKEWFAHWGKGHDRMGRGSDPAAACLDLARTLANDLKTWAAEIDDDGTTMELSTALKASVALLKLEEAVSS